LPPMYPDPNNSLDPAGFWSIHVYAQDPSQAAAPFIAQTSVQNTYYSNANLCVASVNPAPDNSMTVITPDWGTLVSSAPILFGENAADYGLTPGAVYYVVCPSDGCPVVTPNPGCTPGTYYQIQLSTQWIQPVSSPSPSPVPIQGPGGSPGPSSSPIVALPTPVPGASPLQYGMVKPVTQLGSTQLAAGQLYTANNSVTLWFGPVLPPGAPASNWIPTPNSAYYNPLYPQYAPISTAFQLTLRMYYPWGAVDPPPSGDPPSILPCTECTPPVHESYIPPAVVCVSGPTCP
jgi:hypothetical protein